MTIPANFAMVGSKVTKQAQHGKVGVSAGEWVYVPAKGFVGSDHFTLERDFVDNAKAFVTFFEVSMEVMP